MGTAEHLLRADRSKDLSLHCCYFPLRVLPFIPMSLRVLPLKDVAISAFPPTTEIATSPFRERAPRDDKIDCFQNYINRWCH